MNILDLFCGAGGLSLGFSNAGFNIIAGVDHNFHAIKTFQQNHPNAIAVATAIQSIDEDWLSQLNQPIHLICGGPPCQGFSSLGKNQVVELELLPKSLWFNVDWSKLPEARFREAKLHRLNWDAPAPTINTNRRSYYHPDDCRYLTIREAAAIQTLPATFKFPPQPIGEQWKQIGNAVPPEFARQLGLRLNHITVT